MTENESESDSQTEDEKLEDVSQALESSGMVEPEPEPEEADESDESDGLPGPLAVFEELSGTGKDLSAYEDSPIAEAVGPEDSQGALHIARGVDGLSPLGATHPLADIAVGILLLKMESDGKLRENDDADDFEVDRDPSEPGYEDRFGDGEDLT